MRIERLGSGRCAVAVFVVAGVFSGCGTPFSQVNHLASTRNGVSITDSNLLYVPPDRSIDSTGRAKRAATISGRLPQSLRTVT